MSVRAWPVNGLLLAVLWLFVRGVALEPGPLLGELLVGLAVGLAVAYGFRRIYPARSQPARGIRAAPYALLYLLTFVWELLTANLDVAYRTLAPGMRIEPRVVVFPLRVDSELAITSIANSISLTPGTLTMDYDADRHALYVHAIDGRDPEAVVAPIRAWEDYALVIFDEDGKPGDPVPELPARVDEGAVAGTPAEESATEQPTGDAAGEQQAADAAGEQPTAGEQSAADAETTGGDGDGD